MLTKNQLLKAYRVGATHYSRTPPNLLYKFESNTWFYIDVNSKDVWEASLNSTQWELRAIPPAITPRKPESELKPEVLCVLINGNSFVVNPTLLEEERNEYSFSLTKKQLEHIRRYLGEK